MRTNTSPVTVVIVTAFAGACVSSSSSPPSPTLSADEKTPAVATGTGCDGGCSQTERFKIHDESSRSSDSSSSGDTVSKSYDDISEHDENSRPNDDTGPPVEEHTLPASTSIGASRWRRAGSGKGPTNLKKSTGSHSGARTRVEFRAKGELSEKVQLTKVLQELQHMMVAVFS
ncbi:uncharacterized protein LOC117171008 [Belonocnema kinseyi]|uniref:uncharacterized protein LOC117171008 n=1 Tax=Belonocnema kinseyi TaxID=2817044 RepID=UPI00143DB89B|nr:uncharacterized protein LOC117171008 [Belonocnema kinseyi]